MRKSRKMDLPTMARACPDLLPDSPLSLMLAGMIGGLFAVRPELVIGVVVLFVLNAIVSVWMTAATAAGTYISLVQAIVERGIGYTIALLMLTVLSWMLGDIAVLRQIAFGAIGAIETAVALGMLARMLPRFRPVYVGLLRWIDDNTPLSTSVDQIEKLINDRTDE